MGNNVNSQYVDGHEIQAHMRYVLSTWCDYSPSSTSKTVCIFVKLSRERTLHPPMIEH